MRNLFKRKISLLLIKLLARLHNYSYKNISRLAIKANQGLHPKHRITGYHQFFLNNIREGDRILDIGCGNGALTFDLASKAESVLALDLNKKNITLARKNYSAPNIEYRIGDATQGLFKQEFDVIVLSNVLEHIEDRVRFLSKVKKLGPKFLLRVPLQNRDWLTLYKKELGCEWRLDKTHFTEYTLNSFQKELEKSGLKIKDYSIQFGEIWATAE